MSKPIAALVLILAACSSNTNSTGTPPGSPASITISGGDGQQAHVGAAVPVAPSVLVRDAAGTALAGTSVAFAVDSGGGSLAAVTAVTNTSGIATSGAWTLGPGNNVLSATVTGLASIRFHAQLLSAQSQTLVDNATVSSGGGVLRYTKSGDPLDGLTVTVKNGSYPAATTWTITTDPAIQPALPSDFAQVGPAFIVGNQAGYADSVMTLTVPLHVAADRAVAPFYYDAATATLEPVPISDRTDTSVTLVTRHFSRDLMALPSSSASLRGDASLRGTFGAVTIVWVTTPIAGLIGTFSTGFHVTVDNWEFINYGDFQGPAGDCLGMSVSAMYYYYAFRRGPTPATGLYHRYDTSLANQWDNVQGIRFAGAVQADYVNQVQAANNATAALQVTAAQHGTDLTHLLPQWVLLTFKLTKQPVAIGLTTQTSGHEVIAFSATATADNVLIAIADPNFPTQTRTMAYNGGTLVPFQASTSAVTGNVAYNVAVADGVSAMVPVQDVAIRWAEFQQQQAGAGRIPPSYTFETYDFLTKTWGPVTDPIKTTIHSFAVRLHCTGCVYPQSSVSPFDEGPAEIWDSAGQTPLTDGYSGVSVLSGVTTFVLAGMGTPTGTLPTGFIDMLTVRVLAEDFKITTDRLGILPGTSAKFVASNGGLGTRTSKFAWGFGDGTAPVTVTGDSTVSHTFAMTGDLNVTVAMSDTSGKLIGVDTLIMSVTEPTWQLNSVGAVTITLPAGGIGSEANDTAAQQLVTSYLAQLSANPSRGVMIVVDTLGCRFVMMEAFPTDAINFDSYDPNTYRSALGSTCSDRDYTGALAIGALGSGTVIGRIDGVDQPDEQVYSPGSINAQMHGFDFTGYFIWNVRYSTGWGYYKMQFTATQVRPES